MLLEADTQTSKRGKPRNGTGHISKSILCGRCGMVLEGRNATGARGRARRHTPNMFRVRRLNATFVLLWMVAKSCTTQDLRWLKSYK